MKFTQFIRSVTDYRLMVISFVMTIQGDGYNLIQLYLNINSVCYPSVRLNVRRTEWGKSAAFTMRSFRFTTTGTSGDSTDQQQQISCDVKMIPAGSTPIGSGGPGWPLDQISNEIAYKNGHNGPYEDYNKLQYAQMPDCDCYTPEQCQTIRSGFSARAFCALYGHVDQTIRCDDGRNMCHLLYQPEQPIDAPMRGVCENCLNLKSAQDCQERDSKLNLKTFSCLLTLISKSRKQNPE